MTALSKIVGSLSDDEARGLFVRAAQSLLPSPVPRVEEEDVVALLRALREDLGVPKNDGSERVRALLVEALGKELSERVLTGAAATRARARLLKRGLLRERISQVVFSKIFSEVSFGAQRSHVEDAVRRANGVEHLISDLEVEAGAIEQYPSIYTRVMHAASADGFVWIVLGFSRGPTFTVEFALRAYFDETPVRPTSTPVEALRSFAETYGVPFDVHRGSLQGKRLFLENAVFPLDDSPNIGFFGGTKGNFFLVQHFKVIAALGVSHVGWTFVLDKAKYRAALELHGVEIR